MFAEISQRMFSEIMSAFTEVAEMKTKIAKSALYFQSNSFGTSIDEKEKVEVKLHVALVLNITYLFTNLEGIHSAVDVARVSTTE